MAKEDLLNITNALVGYQAAQAKRDLQNKPDDSSPIKFFKYRNEITGQEEQISYTDQAVNNAIRLETNNINSPDDFFNNAIKTGQGIDLADQFGYGFYNESDVQKAQQTIFSQIKKVNPEYGNTISADEAKILLDVQGYLDDYSNINDNIVKYGQTNANFINDEVNQIFNQITETYNTGQNLSSNQQRLFKKQLKDINQLETDSFDEFTKTGKRSGLPDPEEEKKLTTAGDIAKYTQETYGDFMMFQDKNTSKIIIARENVPLGQNAIPIGKLGTADTKDLYFTQASIDNDGAYTENTVRPLDKREKDQLNLYKTMVQAMARPGFITVQGPEGADIQVSVAHVINIAKDQSKVDDFMKSMGYEKGLRLEKLQEAIKKSGLLEDEGMKTFNKLHKKFSWYYNDEPIPKKFRENFIGKNLVEFVPASLKDERLQGSTDVLNLIPGLSINETIKNQKKATSNEVNIGGKKYSIPEEILNQYEIK